MFQNEKSVFLRQNVAVNKRTNSCLCYEADCCYFLCIINPHNSLVLQVRKWKLGKVKWIGQGPEPVGAESGIKHVYLNPVTQALSAVWAVSQQRATWNIEKVPHSLRTLEGLCLWTGPVSVAADCLTVSQKPPIFLAAELLHSKNYNMNSQMWIWVVIPHFSWDPDFLRNLNIKGSEKLTVPEEQRALGSQWPS